MDITTEKIKEFMLKIKIFTLFDEVFLEKIAQTVVIRNVFSGDYIVRQGDKDRNLYLLYQGRLTVFNDDKKISEIAPGVIFGEMSVISKEKRKTSVIALRDSIVFEFDEKLLSEMFEKNYQFLLGLTEIAFKRVTLLPQSFLPQSSFKVLAIFYPKDHKKDFHQFLKKVFSTNLNKKIGIIQEEDCIEHNQFSEKKAHQLLQSYEIEYDLVFLVSESDMSDWSRFCFYQSETIFSFFYNSDDTSLSPIERHLKHYFKSTYKSNYLVMLHNKDADYPTGMQYWLKERDVNSLFNIRINDDKHMARLGRILTGQANCLILSGGGARAAAHFALLRHLDEMDIPIDFIGGVSGGAIVALGYAYSINWNTAYQIFSSQIKKYSGVDLTIPMVALAKGARVNKGLIESFGTTHIEDLWLNAFCVSTLLKSGNTYVHRRGLAWRALRASLSIPGIYPPITNEDGDLLIDGSVSDNMPIKHIPFGFPNLNIILSTLNSADKPKSQEQIRNCDGAISGLNYLLSTSAKNNYSNIVGVLLGAIFNKPVEGFEGLAEKDIHILEVRHEVKYGLVDFNRIENIYSEAYENLTKKNIFRTT